MPARRSPEQPPMTEEQAIRGKFVQMLTPDATDLFDVSNRIARIKDRTHLTTGDLAIGATHHKQQPLAGIMEEADLATGKIDQLYGINLDIPLPKPDITLPYSHELSQRVRDMMERVPAPIRKTASVTPSINSMDIFREIILEEREQLEFLVGFTYTSANVSRDRMEIMWESANPPENASQIPA